MTKTDGLLRVAFPSLFLGLGFVGLGFIMRIGLWAALVAIGGLLILIGIVALCCWGQD